MLFTYICYLHTNEHEWLYVYSIIYTVPVYFCFVLTVVLVVPFQLYFLSYWKLSWLHMLYVHYIQ